MTVYDDMLSQEIIDEILSGAGRTNPDDLKYIYICSPLRGDYEYNKLKARIYCQWVRDNVPGAVPLAVHTIFTQYLDDTIPEDREFGLAAGLGLLKKCDEMYMFGECLSEGMRREIECASKFNIPIRCFGSKEVCDET